MAVLLHGVDIGLIEQRLVNVRLVALHALDKLVLTHHGVMHLAFEMTPANTLPRPMLPLPVLPDISPTRGNIGRPFSLRQAEALAISETNDDRRSSPLWGRCPAGQRGARRNASIKSL